MKTQRSTSYRSLDYGAGALVVLVISVGVAAIVYSVNIIPFDPFNIPAWILGPSGVYTLIYSYAAGKESTYYMVWGAVMFAVAVASALYSLVNPFIVFGILIIVLAVIGIFAHWRSRR